MKIVVPIPKPRNKQLNDVLRSKRCETHAHVKHPSRAKAKEKLRVELQV